ncbi:MAG: endonuclease [Porphyromonadaceae bacterium]|nr:endonuclease [Porphyromonadaceae bacterium]
MNKIFLIAIIFLISNSVFSQTERQNFKIMFYNVENYFDLEDDPEKADEEYLPGGIRAWNASRYYTKQANISKVISAVGGWQPPAIIGLCEVESDRAMSDLTTKSPLKNLGYKYIHYESPDFRGIDVAMMYQRDQFHPNYSEPVHVRFSSSASTTRDILYVRGTVTATDDTLHVFVTHWPSRLGGELESEERRVDVAKILRGKVDSIFNVQPSANIVIMGDFNDHPSNTSILNVLDANPLNEGFEPEKLYNLSFRLEEQGKGSHKFQGEWGMLDQIIVSGNLLDPSNSISATVQDMHVFDADFLLEDDKAFLGKMPRRTYLGMSYKGGFSDHLPVYVDLWY